MHRYEEFAAFQLARTLHQTILEMTAGGPVSHCFKFRENLRDAADSAQRNFPEGFGRFAPGDFARFLDHSRSSLLEVKDGLRSGVERGYWTAAQADAADHLANRALKALSGLQRYLRSPQARRNAERARARYLAGRPTNVERAERNEP